MGISDIRIKWLTILSISSEINKINQDIEALNSREKKSGFFAKLSDVISTTAKKSKSKIDLSNLAKKKDNSIAELGEQLYIENRNGNLILETLSNIFQKVDELKNQIEIKEDEISAIKNNLPEQ